MMSILAEATGGMVGTLGMIIWLVVLFAIMYFLMNAFVHLIHCSTGIKFGQQIFYIYFIDKSF